MFDLCSIDSSLYLVAVVTFIKMMPGIQALLFYFWVTHVYLKLYKEDAVHVGWKTCNCQIRRPDPWTFVSGPEIRNSMNKRPTNALRKKSERLKT